MPDIDHEAQRALAELIDFGDVDVTNIEDEVHIIADAWTVVIAPNRAFVALDDEEGDPDSIVVAAFTQQELVALSRLNTDVAGDLGALLVKSGDHVSQALARQLQVD